MTKRFLALLGVALLSPAAGAVPGPASFAGQVIYQVMPDRFFDGDPSNNAGTDLNNPRAWHSGDLAGLTQKLDYLRKLGVSAVWLTPIYLQQAGRSFETDGYHGYWPADFQQVDPHFGNLDTFKKLVDAAHGQKLKVVLDQVINHFGYTAPALRQHPEWFHSQADCDAASSANKEIVCPLSGLPDLKVETKPVQDLLLANNDFWRAQGVDAFRYDAIKNVPEDFLRALLKRDHSAGTWTLGEAFGADAGTIAAQQRAGFDSLFDFELQAAMKAAIMGGSGLGRVRSALEKLRDVPRPDEVGLFLDNHDLPRFAQGSLFEDQGQLGTRYGLRALMTLRGVPVIWQGTEIAMRGGADPDNRRDMRFGAQLTPGERAVLETAADAIRVRREHPALSVGNQTLLSVPGNLESDLLLLVRADQVSGEQVLVAWNNAGRRATYSLKTKLGPQKLTAGLFADPAGMSVSGGYLHLSLPPKTAMAFVIR